VTAVPARLDGQEVAAGLHFPTSLTFDPAGVAYVAESGLPFDGAPPGGRIWRLDANGTRQLLADGLAPPVNGLTYHNGALWVSEAGPPGRISRLELDGRKTVVIDGLPGPGNYHTNMVAFGPDGLLYFSQGAMTNSGVVGLDAYQLGWLGRLPHDHDVPGFDLVLTGINAETADPLGGQGARATTGAFSPFGSPTTSGQRVQARLPCTAAVMRCRPDGSHLELVAWGLRNAFGIGFLPDGRLLAVDQGADDRGSRPVGNAPDLLFEVEHGGWYGWPDFTNGIALTDARWRPERGAQPGFIIANHKELPSPRRAVMQFPPHAAAVKFDVAPPGWASWEGQLFVALFGDERPMTAPPGNRAGRCVSRVDPRDWSLYQVIADPLLRPIDVRFRPADQSMWVLDFGWFEMTAEGIVARQATGAVWRFASCVGSERDVGP
jgi:glucose/arabinose dehydrogenase